MNQLFIEQKNRLTGPNPLGKPFIPFFAQSKGMVKKCSIQADGNSAQIVLETLPSQDTIVQYQIFSLIKLMSITQTCAILSHFPDNAKGNLLRVATLRINID